MCIRTRREKFESSKSLQPGPDEVIHGTRGIPLGEETPWMRLDEVVELLEEVPDNYSSRLVSNVTVVFVVVGNIL